MSKQEEIDELHERIITMQSLKEHPGWKLFEEVLLPIYDQAVQAASSAPDSFTAAKHLGAMRVSKDLSTWADREIDVSQRMIAQLRLTPGEVDNS